MMGTLLLTSMLASTALAQDPVSWEQVEADARATWARSRDQALLSVEPESEGVRYNTRVGLDAVPAWHQYLWMTYEGLHGARYRISMSTEYQDVGGTWTWVGRDWHNSELVSGPTDLPELPVPTDAELHQAATSHIDGELLALSLEPGSLSWGDDLVQAFWSAPVTWTAIQTYGSGQSRRDLLDCTGQVALTWVTADTDFRSASTAWEYSELVKECASEEITGDTLRPLAGAVVAGHVQSAQNATWVQLGEAECRAKMGGLRSICTYTGAMETAAGTCGLTVVLKKTNVDGLIYTADDLSRAQITCE